MGFFENMKNSITGSDGSGGDFNDEKYDSSFDSGANDQRTGNEDLKPENPPPTEPTGQAPDNHPQSPANQQPGNQSSPGNRQTPGKNKSAGSEPSPSQNQMGNELEKSEGSPAKKPGISNPQAGRPEPGSSEPQVSNETRREMEEAGFNLNEQAERNKNDSKRREIGPKQNSREPVSSQRDDIEEIKSQNEQIIELLKRISDSLQNNPNRRDLSRDEDRRGPSRHGGRR